ncbi:MAG TPA: hypothetical protein VIC26_06855 [Marinagarivorans sp.]
MRYCVNCHSPLTFVAVLSALNPARIRCTTCKHTAKVHTGYALCASALVLAVLLGATVVANYWGYGLATAIAIIIAFSALFECIYYWALQRGIIPSDLITRESLTSTATHSEATQTQQ